jgi:hypothetical protein
MDSTGLTAEKLELAEVFLQPGTGEVQYQVCSPDVLGKLLAKCQVGPHAASTVGVMRWFAGACDAYYRS